MSRERGADDEIPPFRLEDLHGSLRGDYRRPRGGGLWLLLLGALAVTLLWTRDEVRETPPEAIRIAGPGARP